VSPWRREPLAIGIGLDAVSVIDSGVGESPVSIAQARASANPAQSLAMALRGLLEQRAGRASSFRSARVVIAMGLSKYWMMRAPADIKSLAELRRVAQARCAQLFGLKPAWEVAADWDANAPFLCTAVPDWIVAGVRAALQREVRIDTVLPRVLATSLAPTMAESWACVTSASAVAVIRLGQGRLQSVRCMPITVDATPQARLQLAARELRRESLRAQVSIVKEVLLQQLESISIGQDGKVVESEGVRFLPVTSLWPQSATAEGPDVMDDAGSAALVARLIEGC